MNLKIFAMVMLVLVAPSFAAEQKNIVFKNVPDFLRSEWKLVLGPSPKGGIEVAKGSVLISNAIVMFTTREDAKVVGDYVSLEINKVIQFNFKDERSDSGYNTIFQLLSQNGDVVLYPGKDFWHVSIRFGSVGPYATYAAIQSSRIKSLKEHGLYEKFLESQKKLLQKTYSDLSKGLE